MIDILSRYIRERYVVNYYDDDDGALQAFYRKAHSRIQVLPCPNLSPVTLGRCSRHSGFTSPLFYTILPLQQIVSEKSFKFAVGFQRMPNGL
jgi:hypothetical protein